MGILYIIGLPIGNVRDISFRAIDVLKQADIIACEDTRVTGIMLKEYSITTPTLSYYDQIEQERSEVLLKRLLSGENVALVSDAGTPAISDPGYVIVHKARLHNIPVVPVPGPSAVATAISVSGIPAQSFCFVGFLPKKEAELVSFFQGYKERLETLVFFESPNRIHKTLEIINNLYNERKMFLAREISKPYEQYYFGKPFEITVQLQKAVKGEITCVLEGAGKKTDDISRYEKLAKTLFQKGLSAKDVTDVLSYSLELPRNSIKRMLAEINR